MDSPELYKLAYSLHYEKDEFDAAKEKYNELLEKFPNSQEAGWARTQIENINNMTPWDKAKAKYKGEKAILHGKS
jgi:outer membrane protein assembly factor BamD (BamD/ComL family)